MKSDNLIPVLVLVVIFGCLGVSIYHGTKEEDRIDAAEQRCQEWNKGQGILLRDGRVFCVEGTFIMEGK